MRGATGTEVPAAPLPMTATDEISGNQCTRRPPVCPNIALTMPVTAAKQVTNGQSKLPNSGEPDRLEDRSTLASLSEQ